MDKRYFYTYNRDGSIRRKLPLDYAGDFAQNEYLHGVSCLTLIGDHLLMTKRAEGREGAGLLDFLSGHVEGDESGADAMLRELGEEMGWQNLTIADLTQLGRHTLYALNRDREKNWLMDIFLLQLPVSVDFKPQEEEIATILMLPPADALTVIKKDRCHFSYHPIFEEIFAQISFLTSAK